MSTTGAEEVVTGVHQSADAVDVWTDIAAGSYTKDLTWTADATLQAHKGVTTAYTFDCNVHNC
ncbi:hypothetical protein [Acetomicrobium sp.]|uniref:hypothetical protein n=1 Tax=Acetomicrobium sp. TaxID=1872099 RepID=UPI003D9A0149